MTPRLNAQETARWLGLHIRSLRRLARQGKIPCLRVGNRWSFDPIEIMNSGRRPRA